MEQYNMNVVGGSGISRLTKPCLHRYVVWLDWIGRSVAGVMNQRVATHNTGNPQNAKDDYIINTYHITYTSSQEGSGVTI